MDNPISVMKFVLITLLMLTGPSIQAFSAGPSKRLIYRTTAVASQPTPLRLAAWFRIGKMYEKKSDFVSAILLYDRIIARDPKNQLAIARMVFCYDAMIKSELQQAERHVAESSIPYLPLDGQSSDPLPGIPDLT